MTKLERDLVKAIVGRLGGNFPKATVVAQIAAKIALEIAKRAYDTGWDAGYGVPQGEGPGTTFEKFIQDYD